MADFAGNDPMKGQLVLLILCHNLPFVDVAAIIDECKNNSKGAGSHKRRQLYWEGYGGMSTKVSSKDGNADCFITFKASGEEGVEGEVEVIDFTKRQKGLVGSVDLLGKKLKPPEDQASKGWCICFSDEQAQAAWDDIHAAEPCIYISGDGVFVATRYKRVLCKGHSSMPKSLKDVEELVGGLAPDAPLRSISFVGNEPPSVNSYNTFLCGAIDSKLAAALPATIGHTANGGSPGEVYDYFLQRHSTHLLTEAGKMLAQMNTDMAKGLTPIIIASSMKDAATARKNALMKRVFVHESKTAFINKCREDGDSVELNVIKGDMTDGSMGKFADFGGIVFELFYRADLSVFG
jgi:hypothetical protein